MLRATAFVLAALLVASPLAAATYTVTQSGFSFSPDNLIILVGDTVTWVQTGASHTVTNGTGSSDPNAGSLFDDPLDPGNPSFSYTFNTPGVFPYFCRPHENFDMKGTITVDSPVTAEPVSWTRIKRLLGTDTDR